jgi:hypothetical protein
MDLDVAPLDSSRAGHRWIDAAAALCALVISAVSLWVAITNGQTNRQLVAANSWPFLQMLSSNTGDHETQVIELAGQNAGVGPAKVETFEVFWNDEPMRNSSELLRACCSEQPSGSSPNMQSASLNIATFRVAGKLIRAGESITWLRFPLPLRQDDALVWHRLDDARFRLRYRACYCSVFDECWISDLASMSPKPVRACAVPATAYQQ